jgi:hypothetical protein
MSFPIPPKHADAGLVPRVPAAILASDEPAAEALRRIALRWGMTWMEICQRVLAPADGMGRDLTSLPRLARDLGGAHAD